MASHKENGDSSNSGGVVAEQEAGESAVQHVHDDVPKPKPTIRDVQACQFSSWYSTFRNIDRTAATTIQEEQNKVVTTASKKMRKNVTIESIIIRPLPSDFIEYLLSDGVRLPECATKVSSCMNDSKQTEEEDRWASSSSDGEDNDNNSSSTETEPPKTFNFPTLTSQIQSALTTLGGGGNNNKGCMPKLNWSSPKDATWINCGSLKCTKVGDVYLLLKSSDFIMFDLEKAFVEGLAAEEETGEGGDDGSGTKEMNNLSLLNNEMPHDFEYELVLRKWCNLHLSMEFRCFVYEHELVAISQRHPSKFYSHLQPPPDNGTTHNPFTTIIHAFFQTYIQHRFSNGNMHKYVVDLYLDSQERVWIVDFNVWGERTDGLLFDWNELMELGTNMHASSDSKSNNSNNTNNDEPRMPEVRVVTKDMKSMTYDPLSSYRGPTDVMKLMGGGKGDGSDEDLANMPSFQEFMKQCVRPSEM